MIDDICDYCRREFGREPGSPAICLNCGLENVRPPEVTSKRTETVMAAPAVERAVRQDPVVRPGRRRR